MLYVRKIMCSSLPVLELFLGLTGGAYALLPTWHLHQVCGQTIAHRDKGGFLVLESGSFPADSDIDCRVVIQPSAIRSSSSADNYVAFHLADFEVGESCKDTNFTVYDGHGRQTNFKAIAGLKTPLCGSNASLTKDITFFTAEDDFLTVVYQRDKAESRLTSNFNMTFWSFTEGECSVGVFDAFSCNGSKHWCIGQDLVCQNLNPCTDNSDCPEVKLEEVVVSLLAVIIPILIFLLFVACCCCIIQRAGTNYSSRERCGMIRTCIEMSEAICSGIGNCLCTEEKREEESLERFNSDLISTHSDRYEPAQSEAAENDLDSTLSSSSQQNNDYSTFSKEREAAASNYQGLSPSAPPLDPEPDATAPPSYDDVLSNRTLYMKKD